METAKPLTFLFKKHKGLLISAAVSFVGFFPLMGAPGFALISAFQGLIALATGTPYDDSYGDNTWPMAILYAIAFPWIVFLAYQGLKRLPDGLNALFYGKRSVVLAFALSFLGLFVFHAIFCNPEKMRQEYEAQFSRPQE